MAMLRHSIGHCVHGGNIAETQEVSQACKQRRISEIDTFATGRPKRFLSHRVAQSSANSLRSEPGTFFYSVNRCYFGARFQPFSNVAATPCSVSCALTFTVMVGSNDHRRREHVT
jgi:hypothetical protein